VGGGAWTARVGEDGVSFMEKQMSLDDEETVFSVVMNHEEQYSIWPEYKELPRGWTAVGKKGKKGECLDYIDQVWTDMRPLSLRQQMAALEQRDASPRDSSAS
jgi:MbtH protein